MIACERVDVVLSESFPMGVGLRQGCVMSSCQFNIFMEGCMREIKAKVGNISAGLEVNGNGWAKVAYLFAE